MNENEIMDQSELAKSVGEKINYRFFDYFLVKPLDSIKVKKTFNVPVSNEEIKEDANGVKAADFNDVKTEVKEVDSDFRKGVVIKCPTYYDDPTVKRPADIGDIVIFRDAAGLRFDLVKDSRLLRLYDILGVEK